MAKIWRSCFGALEMYFESCRGRKKELLTPTSHLAMRLTSSLKPQRRSFKVSIDVETSWCLPLANRPSVLNTEIETIQTQISNQFAEYKNLPYRLYAVFVHRGSVSFGHYWIYIYDFNRDIWRKYNDEYVTEVQNLDEIFKNNDPANPPTPYFLVYINDRMRDRLVDPVCRDLAEPMPDVQSSDANLAGAVQPTKASPQEDVPMDQSTD
jgi:ubiquitin carboxyl-terminal hydrolase 25/28